MAGIDASKVLVGAPSQDGVSGAVYRAPRGTAPPDDAVDTITQEFDSGGYVSADGVLVTPEHSTTSILDWSGAEVRKILESFTGEVTFSFIQSSVAEAKMIFGEDNVKATAATGLHGNQMKISLGARLPDPGVWVFNMRDGDNAIRVILPDAQPTSVSEMPFVPNSAIPFGTTLSCYPDDEGNSIYICTDDGQIIGASS